MTDTPREILHFKILSTYLLRYVFWVEGLASKKSKLTINFEWHNRIYDESRPSLCNKPVLCVICPKGWLDSNSIPTTGPPSVLYEFCKSLKRVH